MGGAEGEAGPGRRRRSDGRLVRRDEEMDGEWEAPQIPNPACETAPGCGRWKRPMMDNPEYRGKWRAPLVDNPSYQVSCGGPLRGPPPTARSDLCAPQGVWKPRKISNPDYFEDLHPFAMSPFRALGLELWSMTADIYFDNFIVTSRKEVADRWASDSWGLKKLAASANEVGAARRGVCVCVIQLALTHSHTHSLSLCLCSSAFP